MFPQLSHYSLAYPVMLLGLVAPKLKEVVGPRTDQKENILLVRLRLVAALTTTDQTHPGAP